ncbi:kynurenine 3-monooxygenase [candidate division GN15 bacterium]|nr:kynurenine 3-monooxygenase [candidate division GN15 bacterium]
MPYRQNVEAGMTPTITTALASQDTSHRICVIGAGLTGTLLSLYFARRGFEVDVFEKRPDMRAADIPGGRTIVMSLSHRGLRALDGVGLQDAVLKTTFPKYGRAVHLCDGSVQEQAYGRDGDAINTVDRKELNCLLMNKAEATGRIRLFFEMRLQHLDADTGQVELYHTVAGQTVKVRYRAIIGADGIFSQVREQLQKINAVTSHLVETGYSYRELSIPPNEDGTHRLAKSSVHVWPRKNHVLVGLPRHDGSFCCNLFLPSEGEWSLSSLQTRECISVFFDNHFPMVKPLMPDLIDEWLTNPRSDISTVKCRPWHHKDKVMLIGDAAHAIVPFFAMGMNVGFEDCRVFDDLMTTHGNDLGRVFEAFSRLRIPDTDAISDLSYKNFSEISKSPDPTYHTKWTLERQIWELRPDRWMPYYAMIAFSDLPLADTVARKEQQNQVIEQLLADHGQDVVACPLRLADVVDSYVVDLQPLPCSEVRTTSQTRTRSFD